MATPFKFVRACNYARGTPQLLNPPSRNVWLNRTDNLFKWHEDHSCSRRLENPRDTPSHHKQGPKRNHVRDDAGDGGFQLKREGTVLTASDPGPRPRSGWELDSESFLASAANKSTGTGESTHFALAPFTGCGTEY